MQALLLSVIMSVAGVASATQAISLANFTPRIENLPSLCSAAYTSTIEGCQAGDFAANARCSAQCVQGLVKIAELVTRQCANVDVPETSIIGVFMLGAGVPAVCPGVQVTTIGKSSTQPATTQAPPEQTTTEAETTSTSESSSAAATDSASSASSTSSSGTTISSSSSTTEQPTTATQPQITFDTSAMAAPPAQTTAASPQKSNQESGGGSPFDVQASGSPPPLRLGRLATTAMLGLAAFAVVFL